MPSQTIETGAKTRGKKPPFEEATQSLPGSEQEMRNKPDHGELTYRGFGRLNGRAALLTGGDSGIGKAVAIAYAREGSHVALSYLPEDEQDTQETIRWIREAGRAVRRSQGGALLPGTGGSGYTEFGRLDILVNNAAYQELAATQDSSYITGSVLDLTGGRKLP